MSTAGKLPAWLKRRIPAGGQYGHTQEILSAVGQETICENANCPNKGECWGRGTATVLILGNICTRRCRFCSVGSGKPEPVDAAEPARVAELAKRLKLKYLVITSVDRDDLADGGAGQFRDVIKKVRDEVEGIRFEILVPDFRDCQDDALEILGEVRPFVFGHNVETVPSLYLVVRGGGDYGRSLELLRKAKAKWADVATKSSIMLGLGESESEVEGVLRDLRGVGCERVTIGQYLKPSKESVEVVEYVEPEKFEWWRNKARSMGFLWVMSSPFVRSSFWAESEGF